MRGKYNNSHFLFTIKNSCKMTKKKSYDEMSVVKALNKKAGCRVYYQGTNGYIEVAIDATDIGNGSWGKIDYLIKVHGFFLYRVNKIGNKRINYYVDDDKTDIKVKRNKINMAAMTKDTMRKNRK